jgi:acyl-CoA-binding protein
MADESLDEQFQRATVDVQTVAGEPGNDVKLRLYGLFKQASAGDVTGKRPGFTNPVGRAKHDAWAQNTGMSSDDAKRAYIAQVNALRGA